jgi:small subunit ribosomal protein S2
MSEIDLKAKTAEETITDPELLTMMEAGVFYGRTRNKTNPRMKQFVLANRNGVEVINLEKTKEQIVDAAAFVKSAAARNASMIVLATQPSAHESLGRMSEEFAVPAVTRRWLGGTLTNYRVIAKRVEYFKKLKDDLVKGAFKGYTKKEQLDLEKEAEKLEETLSGLENMAGRPEVLIVVDPAMHRTAVLEAHRLRIPVVALMSTDADPLLVQYPVVGNTKAKTSIDWFSAKIAEAIRAGKKEAASAAAKVAEKKPEAAA